MQDATNRKQTNIFRLHEAWIGLRIIQDVAKLHVKFAKGLNLGRKKNLIEPDAVAENK